ncbi:MAG: peptide-binding protein, partial [Bacteroides sp.]|nr:peptide-binding protein [Bacteroides sp.]
MKARVEGELVMDMLVVNGQIRHMARYPNFDEKAVRFNGTSAQATAPARVRKWKNPAGGYVHAMHNSDWGDFHYRINGKDAKGNLHLEGGWQNNRPSGIHPDNRMVENIFEELDAPGEWYYAANEHTLYYYPTEEEKISEALFESPQLKHLIELRLCVAQPQS